MKNEEGKSVSRAEAEAIALYGGVALLVGGAAGVYVPFFMGKAPGVDALATYVFAVLAPIGADLLLYEPYWKRVSKVLKLRLGFFGSLAAILAIAALLGEHKDWGMLVGAVAMILVLPIWFYQAVYSGRFRPEPTAPPKGPIGGESVSTEDLGGEGLPS